MFNHFIRYYYKFKNNLPIINFAISATSLYLQCNYLLADRKYNDKKIKNSSVS
jgi:hypothetical protein